MAKHKHHHHSRHRTSFWSEFRFEITVTLLLLTGIALLVEKFEIRRTVWHWIQEAIKFLSGHFSNLAQRSIDFIMSFKLSNSIGILLILIAFFMIFNRFRKKMIVRYSLLDTCPNCDSDLRRIHRTWQHKLIGYFMWADVKNYECKKCDYRGIKMDWKHR